MPAFRCRWNAARGAAQLRSTFERIRLDETMFNAAPFTRLAELKYLKSTEQLDDGLFWTTMQHPVAAAAA
jgi:hypothetical protein